MATKAFLPPRTDDHVLPCLGHADVFDTLIDRETDRDERRRARKKAVGLCGSCAITASCPRAVKPRPAEPQRPLADPTPGPNCAAPAGAADHSRRRERACQGCLTAKRTSARERRYLNAQRTWPCGSPGGAQRHRRWGEEPCEDCLTAEQESHQEWRLHRIAQINTQELQAIA